MIALFGQRRWPASFTECTAGRSGEEKQFVFIHPGNVGPAARHRRAPYDDPTLADDVVDPIAVTIQRGFGPNWMCCLLVLIVAFSGCRESVMTSTLPAPIREEVRHNMEGRVYRVWEGDRFEFGDSKELHYVMLRGVRTPREGQPFFLKARNTLNAIIRDQRIRVEVVGRDEMMREQADVFVLSSSIGGDVDQLNVGLKMIELGFGWYDGDEFQGAEEFRQAQQSARAKELGIWGQPPIPGMPKSPDET